MGNPSGAMAFALPAGALPGQFRVAGPVGAPAMLKDLAAEMHRRAESRDAAADDIFLVAQDLQRFKCLRPDEDFQFSMDDTALQPARWFAAILAEGGPLGIHVLASTDTWNNTSRWLPRKVLAEFSLRVLFQMSASDSANLIDSPAAASLGMHRALLHDEHTGEQETFRPYAMPDEAWFLDPAARG